MSELAAAAKADQIQFRLDNTTDPRVIGGAEGRAGAAVAEHQPQQRAVDVRAADRAVDVDVARAQLGRVALAHLVEGPHLRA